MEKVVPFPTRSGLTGVANWLVSLMLWVGVFSFVQVTVEPVLTVRLFGSNWKLTILTAGSPDTVPALASLAPSLFLSPPPQAPDATTTTTETIKPDNQRFRVMPAVRTRDPVG